MECTRDSKFANAKCASAAGTRQRVSVGRLDVWRDWGYAPEYVEAMWSMLQRDEPDDFVIATGEAHTIAEFATAAFAEFDLDAAQHIDIDETLFRPSDISWSRGAPAKAERVLGWTARTKFSELVKILCEAEKRSAEC